MVEQAAVNRWVVGSSPTARAKREKMNKILDWFLKTNIWKVILVFSIISFSLAIISIKIGQLIEKNSYSSFISNFTDNQTVSEISEGLRMAVSEGVISRKDLRNFLKENPITVYRYENISNWQGYVEILPGETTMNLATDASYSVIIHESFHVAMLAANIPASEHHEVMRQEGWCFGGC